jgi:biopolymer transport protein ExbD
MAEINNKTTQQKNQRTICKKKSTRVDLTPMVDLGFILITFFVFTAALSQPKAMNLLLPNDNEITSFDEICESCVITFIPGKNNELYYYQGKEKSTGYKLTDYSSNGIRKLMIAKKEKVFQIRGKDEMVIIIKPTAHASFKNFIDVVDECNISKVNRYYIEEISPIENTRIAEISPSIIIQ